MRIVGVVQARLGSTRLPGKALADINGKPMVVRVLERVARATCLADNLVPVIAAIPFGAENKDLFDVITDAGYATYSGPERDLIARLSCCAHALGVDAIIRITGDCPLASPSLIDAVAYPFLACGDVHYCSNVLPRTYPDGLDVEIYTTELLDYLFFQTRGQKHWQENFSTFLWNHDSPKIRKSQLLSACPKPHYRWTVDTQEDLDWVRWVYGELDYLQFFDCGDVFNLLEEYPNKVRTQDDYVH